MMKTRTSSSGFSLLELLLSLAVFASVILALFSVMQGYAKKELARSVNKYMSTVAQAMDQILKDPASFNALYDAAKGAANNAYAYQLYVDGDPAAGAQDNIAKNFKIGTTWIQGSRLLNANFSPDSPLRTGVRILLLIADDPTTEIDPRAFDVLVVTRAPREDELIQTAARNAGEAGGFLIKGAGSITHSYGSWSVATSRLLETDWYKSDVTPSTTTATSNSFLVRYNYANLADKSGDYLYRIPDADVSRNTMYGPLNIGGNDIVGADNLNIGNNGSAHNLASGEAAADCQGNVLCVNGTGILKGSGVVSGTMTAAGSALVADSMNVGTMRINNGLDATARDNYGAQAMFVVDGNGNDGGGVQDQVNVTGTAHFTDGATVTSGGTSTQRMTTITAVNATMPEATMPGDGMSVGTINADHMTSSTMSGNNLTADDQLKAGIVRNADVTIATGRAGVIDIRGSQDLQYGSASQPRILSVPIVNIQALSVNDFGNCANGCGQ